MLLKACDKRTPITFTTIWNPKTIHTVIPYQLSVGKEEMFNYFLCAENNNITCRQEAKSYRLNRIANINYSRAANVITEDVSIFLNRMLQYGPQYMINDDEESCVKLSDLGIRNYSRIYFGRPQVDRIEESSYGNYYYFKGSKDQVFLYFRRFGSDATIVAPDSLKEKMADFHLKAYQKWSELFLC